MRTVVLAAAISCAGPGLTHAQPAQVEIRAPYVQTPPEAVSAMLELAAVAGGDVVYDLGAGDGRIVIAAVRRPGVRAVGIELDPGRVRGAREAAEKEGLGGRAEFLSQDFFEADLRGATVVTLFLLPDQNRKLRPKLWNELKPGARVVSFCFDMGPEWKPERQIEAAGCKIYRWRAPGPPAAE